MNNSLIKLGECRKPHGVKGGFSLFLYNKDSSVLKKGSLVTLFPVSRESIIPSEGITKKILSISFGNKPIVFFEGVSDRNRVEELIPFEVLMERERFPEAREDEFYLSDLIGCKAFDMEGLELGIVVELDSNGVQDILIIEGSDESFEVLLVESFVREINIDEKKIIILKPELI